MSPIPARREDIPVLPNDFQRTDRGDRFLLFDSGVGDINRIIIFATDNSISLLAENSHSFMDGTFKVCPEIFFQVYTIHVLLNNQTFQTRQRKHTTDFERAALNAINNQLNHIQVKFIIILLPTTSVFFQRDTISSLIQML